jgi:hypothetical protein
MPTAGAVTASAALVEDAISQAADPADTPPDPAFMEDTAAGHQEERIVAAMFMEAALPTVR